MQQFIIEMTQANFCFKFLPMVDTLKKRFGTRLAEAMKKANKSDADIMKALSVSREMPSKYKSGKSMPRWNKTEKLAELVGLSPGCLYFGEGCHDQNYRQLTSDKRVLLELFDGLINSQRMRFLQEMMEEKQKNDDLIRELGGRPTESISEEILKIIAKSENNTAK